MNLDQPQQVNDEQVEKSKKVRIVPIEELIPEIKPSQEEPVEGINYESSDLQTSYAETFFKMQVGKILHSSREFLKEQFPSESAKQESLYDETLSILKEKFKDQIVVDLGFGNSDIGFFLASLLGAKAYVAVDNYPINKNKLDGLTETKINEKLVDSTNMLKGGEWEEKNRKILQKVITAKAIPVSIVKDNILDFLRRLPDNSVSFFAFGVDINMIPDDKYIEAVNREMQRVLSQKGGYLELRSAFEVGGTNNPFEEPSNRRLKRSPFVGNFVAKPRFFVKE